MIDLLTAFPGISLGIILGFVLQRGRFCMNSAFRDIPVFKDYTLLKAVVLAVVFEMIIFHLLALMDIVSLSPPELFWPGAIIGGFLFGIGMAFAAGCASGTTYRVGEGMMGSLMALLGLIIGGYTTENGILSVLVNNPDLGLRSTQFRIAAADGSSLTLGNVFGTSLTPILTWGIVILLTGASIILLVWKAYLPWKKKGNKIDRNHLLERIFKGGGWKWWITGIAIGLIGSIAIICTTVIVEMGSCNAYPLGFIGGWNGLLGYIITGADTALSWSVFLVIGVVMGAFIAANIAGEFKLRAPKDGKVLFLQFVGGTMMGIGAVFAGGCNISNTLIGVPQLSVASIITTIFIILGVWVKNYSYWLEK
ncbi:MAG: YeeE/YedE family protein [Candidatus Heimdallarchaeota archaeon]|nr:MAG: YeeE/YedE family protein [Candidatus Heimdallarchaeota archaeon]